MVLVSDTTANIIVHTGLIVMVLRVLHAGRKRATLLDMEESLTTIHLTGCKFSVAQMLRSSAQIEGDRIRRERCAQKNAWDSEPA